MLLYIGTASDSFFIEDTAKQIDEDTEILKGVIDIKEAIVPATAKIYTHIIFNVDTFINEATEIVETIRKIEDVSNANIVIYAKGYEPTSTLVQACYYAGYKNYILSPILSTMKDQCYKCLTGYYDINGVPFEEELSINDPPTPPQEDITKEAIRQAQKRKVSVGVAGGVHRIGTTTQAIQMCKYLTLQGYKPCYIEMNPSGYIKALLDTRSEDEYQYKEAIGLVKYNGVDIYIDPDYLPSIKRKDYDFFIYDCGCFNDDDFNEYAFLDKDLNVLICGIKPFEYEGTEAIINQTLTRNDCHYIFTFIENEGTERKEIMDLMEEKSDHTSFAESVFNPFAYKSIHNKTYENIFAIIPRTISKKKEKKPFWKRK